LLGFSSEDGVLTIDHPGTEVYDTLVAMPASDARRLANETLQTLSHGIAQAQVEGRDTSSLDDLLSQIDAAVAAGNHLLSRQLGLEALDLLRTILRPRVLFDEAHDERNTLSWQRALTIEPQHPDWVYFGALTEALEDEFTFHRNPDAPLSLDFLRGYDGLVVAAPNRALNAAELEAVNRYVMEGGGLLVLGDCGLDHPVNSLTSDYNITFDSRCIFDSAAEFQGDFEIDRFTDHQAVKDVPHMMTNWGGSLTARASAVPLAMTGEDIWQDRNWNTKRDPGEPTGPFTVAAASAAGQGRVAAVADNAFQDDAFEWRSNDMIMRSLLRWVTGWHPTYGHAVYVPVVFR
jgi:hypothetical protein